MRPKDSPRPKPAPPASLRRRTGIVKDPRYAEHCMGPGEPECPERLDVLYPLLDEPELADAVTIITPRPAKNAELETVHAARYIRRLEATAGGTPTYLDEDTRTAPGSHDAALLAAGGLCRAIKAVHTGQVDNAFAWVRPPGHHAERAASGGFCLYNNIAIGTRFAQNRLKLARILVVDFDLHHGNGTQHCFEDDPSVLFFSTHRAFTYPHTGRVKEIGKGPGRGFTINTPLLSGAGDGDFLALFERLLRPVAMAFKPDLVLVSAGFDIHTQDPLGGMRVTPDGFAAMTRILMEVADACCQGRLVLALEGGYDLDALRASVREVLREMTGRRRTDIRPMLAAADQKRVDYICWRVSEAHRKYWPCLNGQPVPTVRARLKGMLARWAAYFKS
ncbi:Histone deacetylase family protein [Desulfosarcina cetonica]|uniref:histone deacetylase family protein n=1 Tax=Desulfosarcina cetonica TaxID=90730 RepID=UPI0009FA2304|nr:histone deacetylase [Desulfosarcina cetonica]VTR70565.1 Histone deacetylase family protein [Desulfosarcina cetonica]